MIKLSILFTVLMSLTASAQGQFFRLSSEATCNQETRVLSVCYKYRDFDGSKIRFNWDHSAPASDSFFVYNLPVQKVTTKEVVTFDIWGQQASRSTFVETTNHVKTWQEQTSLVTKEEFADEVSYDIEYSDLTFKCADH